MRTDNPGGSVRGTHRGQWILLTRRRRSSRRHRLPPDCRGVFELASPPACPGSRGEFPGGRQFRPLPRLCCRRPAGPVPGQCSGPASQGTDDLAGTGRADEGMATPVTYAGEEISDIVDALRVGLYMVRGPAATSRLRIDPAQEPRVRYLAKGSVPDHGEEWTSSGHRDYDYLEWIARLTSHIPDRGTQLVHYMGLLNAHRGSRQPVPGLRPQWRPGNGLPIHPIPRRPMGARVSSRFPSHGEYTTAKGRRKRRRRVAGSRCQHDMATETRRRPEGSTSWLDSEKGTSIAGNDPG
jgi:hypothetical protein